MFLQTEKLKAIIDGSISGVDAADVLRLAVVERREVDAKVVEYGGLIKAAEDRIVYGDAGRPGPGPRILWRETGARR
ncbi:hypothetical protein [Janthinobacterium sp.]|uniref:hypothetical protein n=1 Tax=Janthinobacterium sp. TaxID=1871054 RepID=UPI00293D26B3|nr:hypothetical protein [Janthinobacterium sp.]